MDNRDKDTINGGEQCEKSPTNTDLQKDLEANNNSNGASMKPIECYDPDQQKSTQEKMVTYGIEDNPPIHLGMLLGLQVSSEHLLMLYNLI